MGLPYILNKPYMDLHGSMASGGPREPTLWFFKEPFFLKSVMNPT